MSVTFIDPPGPLTNTTEPIDFTTSRSVVSISVEFNPETAQGSRETVWDGPDGDGAGDFSYAYRTSTRTGAGPYTWSVRRNTAWPSGFRIRVQELEEPPVPVSAGFNLLYAVDFATLANQTMVPGANTLSDGQRWWMKGSLSYGDESIAIVNGVGLRERQRTLTSLFYNPLQIPASMMLDFSDLPGYNPDAPLFVQYRYQEMDLSYSGNVCPMCTIVTAVGDANPVQPSQLTGRSASFYDADGGQWRYFYCEYPSAPGLVTPMDPSPSLGLGALNLNVFCMATTVAMRVGMCGLNRTASAGSWPDISGVPPASNRNGAIAFGIPSGADPTPNQGFAFWGANNVGPAFGIMQNSLRALRVYQTGV